MIQIREIKAAPKNHSVELEVVQQGMVVRVPGGPFRFNGQDFILPDFTYTAETSDDDIDVQGVLVVAKEGGVLELVVDEVVVGAGEPSFSWRQSPYDKLMVLFRCRVPAGVTTLDDVEVIVRHLVEPPKVERKELTSEEQAERETFLRGAAEQAKARRAARSEAANEATRELRRQRAEQEAEATRQRMEAAVAEAAEKARAEAEAKAAAEAELETEE